MLASTATGTRKRNFLILNRLKKDPSIAGLAIDRRQK
jgi:hypothetical protein